MFTCTLSFRDKLSEFNFRFSDWKKATLRAWSMASQALQFIGRFHLQQGRNVHQIY